MSKKYAIIEYAAYLGVAIFWDLIYFVGNIQANNPAHQPYLLMTLGALNFACIFIGFMVFYQEWIR